MIRALIVWTLLLAATTCHAGDPLQLRVRPQLPARVHTIAQAATYYLAPTGYKFFARTPRSGDMRPLVHGAVRMIPDDAGPITIETALLSIVPPGIHLYVDHHARAVAFGAPP